MLHAPWVRWPVSIVAVLWYLVSTADYLLTKLRFAPYVSAFTPDQLAYFSSLPLWADIGWAAGVWAGLAGACLLAFRARNAALMFAVSFAGLASAALGLIYLHQPPLQDVTGRFGVQVVLGAILAALLLFLYARVMNARPAQG